MEFGPPLPAESVPQMFATTNVVDSPPVVESVTPAPIVELAPAPTVAHMAPGTTKTTPTAAFAAPVLSLAAPIVESCTCWFRRRSCPRC